MIEQHANADEPTVFVVDDDEDMRNALIWLMESVALPVRAYGSAEEFLEHGCARVPGCLLLDLRMPGMGGMALLERLRRASPPLMPTIVLTGHGDVPTAVQALKAGAFDFVEKPAIQQQLLDRVQAALATDAVRRHRADEIASIRRALNGLTERQREVLDWVIAGEPSKCIALRLGISERTVETYRRMIMKKMQARSLAALVRMVAQQRIGEQNSNDS